MAWTSPRTWILGELVTETLLNTHLRDNLLYLKANPVIAEGTATNDISTSAFTPATMITLSSVVIPADVGAVYVEAWAPTFGWFQPAAAGSGAVAELAETTAGLLADVGVSRGQNANDGSDNAPLYVRTRDLAWAGSTRTVTLGLGISNSASFISARTASPAVLRIVRSY